VHRTESENLAGTGNRKMKLIMRIRTKSMEETYGVALVPATASSGEKARPRVADESWVEERKLPKTAAKTISDGDDIFETQE
jgi:hypothetical protein